MSSESAFDRKPITTHIETDEQGSPLRVKAKHGMITVGWAYDPDLSLVGNHRAVAHEMALILGWPKSDIAGLIMVQHGDGFTFRTVTSRRKEDEKEQGK